MNWAILDQLPDGWQIDETVGTPVHGCVFVTNGKSVINGQKRALLRLMPYQPQREFHFDQPSTSPGAVQCVATQPSKTQTNTEAAYPARSVNELARKRMMLRLLADIRVDLEICELEGWPKTEYLCELQRVINSFTNQPNHPAP